ncbi:PREDICTED: calmodulin-binding transcription activator 5 isoform X2 [Tarenaya hassleriana]|uniref:calmodulin-binding transcription activator 5 isoform X2 n=1 Tax=Tarenaya hassleriana TaxID=28532 RepID=UPI00053C70FD|nr:PREDICTED: calmodulin-binding transcription activator 5 isoform X2 [Tarenaya hassleriana]
MDGAGSGRLVGSDIHGFHTLQDLDVPTMLEEAKGRWLRPNEIHAVLCNHKYFCINVKPMNLPKSGTIVLFDRKMLRNFRKDGHNWKKKKDGKTVKEAHEHLKVGNEERIHVYYAHGEDNPTFVRRCYWLLDKTLEHIVLVHYRETQEVQTSPATPGNTSSISDHSSPTCVAGDIDSGVGNARYVERNDPIAQNHEIRLHEINTLEWDELLVPNDDNSPPAPTVDDMSYLTQTLQNAANGSAKNGNHLASYNASTDVQSFPCLGEPSYQNNNLCDPGRFSSQQVHCGVDPGLQNRDPSAAVAGESVDALLNNGLQSQESFGRWMNAFISDSPGSVDDPSHESTLSPGQDSLTSPAAYHHQSNMPEQIFSITDVSPAWAFSTEKTKILVTGFFHDGYQHQARSNLFCICGETCVPAEIIQVGVYRCFLPPQSPAIVNLYLSDDGQKPISQFFSFECRSAAVPEKSITQDNVSSRWEEFEFQVRLAHLLFTSSNKVNILSSEVSAGSIQEAKKFVNKTSHLLNSWAYLVKSVQGNQLSFEQAKDNLFELTLKNRLKEWLLEKVLEGGKITEYDSKGLGVIHLCAILGYTWSIHLFSWSGLSLNFRDKLGWTALHWAAYYGREKMVAALLSAGARPNLVTDPTKKNVDGCTAADLAQQKGYDGLAAYLSEKCLVAQFKDMKIAGNISGNLETCKAEASNPGTLTEEEQSLKDTLTAYRTAAEAASRIQVAFREHALNVRSKAVQFGSREEEAQSIIAAMKIQHAFRNHDTRKKMAAAVRIQYRFHTWKMRREFLNMRRQVIKIQAAFRGFQVRRQYRKIVWSVGVLEKAILRWRLKRKGFRGMQVSAITINEDEGETEEEDFYKTSQRQAEDRLERSVVRVQAMFRSKKAQQDYRRMKLAHEEAQLEYDGLQELDDDDDDTSRAMER